MKIFNRHTFIKNTVIPAKVGIFILLALFTTTTFAKLNIFTCEPEWASLASEIGGDKIEAFSATHGKQDPHFIQARPSLIAKIRKADLLVCTGAELEVGWLPLLLRKSSNSNIQPGQSGHFLATNFVNLLEKPTRIDRSQGDVHSAGNPHIQSDPRRMAEVAKQLSLRMQQLDPDNTAVYQKNTSAFLQKWNAAIQRWQQKAVVLKGKSMIAHHKSWIYLADWLHMKIIGYLEPKPGAPPTAIHLSQLLNVTKNNKPDMIIYAAYQNPKSAKWLEKRTGVPSVELPFTIGGTEKASDLFGLIDDTLDRMIGATK